MINRYITVEKDFAQASFTEKKSEFIGYGARVESEEQAKSFIERIRREHSDATHTAMRICSRIPAFHASRTMGNRAERPECRCLR